MQYSEQDHFYKKLYISCSPSKIKGWFAWVLSLKKKCGCPGRSRMHQVRAAGPGSLHTLPPDPSQTSQQAEASVLLSQRHNQSSNLCKSYT